MSEALKVPGALLIWVQLFLKQLVDNEIQFEEIFSTMRTRRVQPALCVHTVLAVRNIVVLYVRHYDAAPALPSPCAAAWLVDFNPYKKKSSEQKRSSSNPVTISDDHALAVFPLERKKL